MKNINLVTAVFALAVGGFTTEPELEQLLGVSVGDLGISFQVSSNGCTTKNDFSFDVVEKLESLSPMLPALVYHYYITVRRNMVDLCEDFIPYGTFVFMSFEELGIAFGKFHVKNPIGGDKIEVIPSSK